MIQSMGLTSVFYNGVQVPPKFDSSFLRVSPTSPKSSRIQFSQFHFHTSHSEGDIPGSRSSHGINNVETSHITSSSNLKENKSRPEIYASSVRAVALCVCTAVAFGTGLGLKDGVGKASEFFAGYLLEQSLSVDNLFVFVLIFKYFKVPIMYQSKVLSYGIAGAIVFRLSIILLGTATLQRFEAVNLLLAAILLYSSFKLFAGEEEDSDLSDNFIVKTCQKFIPVTFNKTVFTSFKGDPAKETGGVFDYLETALHKFDDGPFFLGQFSMVDMAYVPFIERFQLLIQDVWKYDIMAGRPKLEAWFEEMNKVDAYKQSKYDPKENMKLWKKHFLGQE